MCFLLMKILNTVNMVKMLPPVDTVEMLSNSGYVHTAALNSHGFQIRTLFGSTLSIFSDAAGTS